MTEATVASQGQDTEQGKSNAAPALIAAGVILLLCVTLGPPAALGGLVLAIITVAVKVIFGPILWLIKLFVGLISGGASGGESGPEALSGGKVPSVVASAVSGDGSGTLKTDTIPPDLVKPIEDAGNICTDIGPVVIASIIDQGSAFKADYTGSDGRQGIAPLAPDVFAKWGQDDDHNGQVSAFDTTDSIMATGRYLCDLAKQTQKLKDDGDTEGEGSVLDYTLAAYLVGYDKVRDAKGLPQDQEVRTQILVLRGLFAKYKGGDAPKKKSPSSSPSSSKTPAPSDTSGNLTEAKFDELFPGRNSFYTYASLSEAMKAFPEFANSGSDTAKKQELAAFLANVSHETGGLGAIVEENTANYGNYCDPNASYGCPAGKASYYGRGPLQLSWNTNYKSAGDALGIDLLNDPDRVAKDSSVAWKAALWFWMNSSGAGSVTPHNAILNNGFGETIRSINGKIECAGGPGAASVQSRVTAYQNITKSLGVEPGNNLSC
jgi:glycosyl hydrolase family 19 (putative chitinase)